MTPELRAARDRLAAFLRHPGLRRDVEPGDPADVIAVITGRLDMPRLYKSDLRLLLAALDRHEAVAESVRETARQVAEHAERFGPVPDRVEVSYIAAGPRGQCEGCGCCIAAGCHRGPDSLCPTNSLGESVCPCTED